MRVMENLMFEMTVGGESSHIEMLAHFLRKRIISYARAEMFLWKTDEKKVLKRRGWVPDLGWKWLKWTFGFWSDPKNHTLFGIDIGPLEIVWRYEGYRP